MPSFPRHPSGTPRTRHRCVGFARRPLRLPKSIPSPRRSPSRLRDLGGAGTPRFRAHDSESPREIGPRENEHAGVPEVPASDVLACPERVGLLRELLDSNGHRSVEGGRRECVPRSDVAEAGLGPVGRDGKRHQQIFSARRLDRVFDEPNEGFRAFDIVVCVKRDEDGPRVAPKDAVSGPGECRTGSPRLGLAPVVLRIELREEGAKRGREGLAAEDREVIRLDDREARDQQPRESSDGRRPRRGAASGARACSRAISESRSLPQG